MEETLIVIIYSHNLFIQHKKQK